MYQRMACRFWHLSSLVCPLIYCRFFSSFNLFCSRYCVVPQTAGAAPAVVVPPPTNRHSRQASHQLLPGTFPGDEDEIMRDLDLD